MGLKQESIYKVKEDAFRQTCAGLPCRVRYPVYLSGLNVHCSHRRS